MDWHFRLSYRGDFCSFDVTAWRALDMTSTTDEPSPTTPLGVAGDTSLRDKVLREVIAPDFEREVRDVVAWRHNWRKIANWSEGIAHLLLVVATALAYSAGYFDSIRELAYAAGCVNVVVLALLRFAAYANKESSERNAILNRFLKLLGIEAMPDITADAEASAAATAPRAGAEKKDPAASEALPAAITAGLVPVQTRVEAEATDK